ncbi:Ger(x)C family spore germination protein [Cohnella sp. JJ-181]|uniref:Ger(x)C family spore germination protein n=1 Tax=Cohnella rhizoplanae TaxID=2974897 RepID=UPI0022FFA298|nr:Ger(x)C family spore germination protein [Cohnella sp. JJ-181]CAI6087685.1 Spore germination protein B3 [Cohnella sp. JJ-181]
MKRRCLVVVLIVSMLSGCTDQREINDVALVLATGIDKTNHEFNVTLQIPISKSAGTEEGSKEVFYLENNSGRSVQEALGNIQKQMPRILRFSHQQVIVINEEIARNNISEILDFFNRNRESRLTSYIYISEKETFNVLNTHPKLSGISAQDITGIGRLMGSGTTTREFLSALYREGSDPVASVVNNDNGKLTFNKMAVFKNRKMKFITNESQTLGLLWMKRSAMKGKSITFVSKHKQIITVNVSNHKFKMKATVMDGIPECHIRIAGKGYISESEESLDLSNKKAIHEIEESLELDIKRKIMDILELTLRSGIDILGIGNYLYVHKNLQWEKKWKDQWDTMLAKTKIDIDVNFRIENTGLNINTLAN